MPTNCNPAPACCHYVWIIHIQSHHRTYTNSSFAIDNRPIFSPAEMFPPGLSVGMKERDKLTCVRMREMSPVGLMTVA